MAAFFKNISHGLKKRIKSNHDNQDPFLVYGSGVKSYFTMLKTLIALFSFLSLLAAAQMGIFKYADGLNYENSFSKYIDYSYGNMGIPRQVCAKNILFND